MSDTIDRQAAIGAIVKLPNAGIHWFVSTEGAIKALEALPPAEPEIIRCKDCKYHRYKRNETGDIPYCSNFDYGYGWKDNDFCSRAERREE